MQMFEQNPLARIPEIDAMRLGVDFRLEIKVRKMSIMVRPISVSETLKVAAEVVRSLTLAAPEARNKMTENILTAKETLKLASTSDVGKTDYQLTDIILDAMTPDELNFVFKQYVAATDKVNPCLETMEPDKLDELIEALKKTPKPTLVSALTGLSFSELLSISERLLAPSE
jgi:hypothetical protein